MENWKNRRVLITGADGFIGKRLAARLLASGAEVHGTVTRTPPKTVLNTHTLRLPGNAEALFKEIAPEIVFHLAALLPRAKADAATHHAINMRGTRDVYEAALMARAEDFIALGTMSEYGAIRAPFLESASLGVTSDPYANSKRAATEFLMSRHDPLRVTLIRPSIVYGPGQISGMFIPECIAACLNKKIFPMTHGEQRLDFLYIDDLIDALLRVPSRTGKEREIINIGSGVPERLLTVAHTIARTVQAEPLLRVGVKKSRLGEVMERYLSIAKASSLLNWKPVTALDSGLYKTIAWYRAMISGQ